MWLDRTLLASVTLACLSACTGTISGPQGVGDPPNGTGAGGSAAGVSGRFSCPTNTIDPGPTTMQLLTRDQYLATARDLLGSNPQVDALFANASDPSTFGLVQGNVAQVDLENYGKAAEILALAAVTNGDQLAALAPCAAGADRRGCARAFIQSFGSRAYRAPLTDNADIDRHLVLYDVGASTSYAHGIEMILRGVLQAPRFLYRVETGTGEAVGSGAVKLSGFEVAARLSYALWNTMPDARLTAAAAHGELGTSAGVSAQLAWMIADPRGRKVVRRFLEGWIHLSDIDTVVKDDEMFPDWSGSTLRTSMHNQAETFFDYILDNQSGRLSSLFTSPTVFVDQALSSYYGTSATVGFQSIQRTDGTASGMLTLPALMTTLAKPTESSPIYRGKFVREQMFCQELPAPPANVPKPPDTQPGVSTREKFKQHEADPACAGCHTLIDPLGFGFENFDAVGRYRTTDNGAVVDASGEVSATFDANGKFAGVADLGKKLATSAEVEECVARQWFRFFSSRFEQDVDGCSMKTIVDQLRAADRNLNQLPTAIVQTDAFRYRRPID